MWCYTSHYNLHIFSLVEFSLLHKSCRAAFSFFLLVLAKSGGCIVSNYCDCLSYITFCIQFLSWNVKYQVQLPSGMQAWKTLIQAFNSVGNNINIWHILDAVLDPPVAYTTFGRRAMACNRLCNNLICLLHGPGIFGTVCARKWYLQFVLLIYNLIASPMLGPAWISISTYISHMETLKCKRAMLYKRSSSRRRQSS
jgi:hypothetical protein